MLGTSLRHGSLTEVRDQGLEFLILVGSTRHQASKAPWEAPTHFLRSEKCRKVSAQRRFFYAFFYRNTVDRLHTDGLPKPTEAGSQHQHRWGQGWEGQPVSRSGFTFEESPEIAGSWVHDLSFFPCQIRNSPGNAIHCSFFLIEIMSPKPLVASNSFIHESRSFPSGDYQHLKERSSNPCDQGKTVQHQLCLVSGARNSKLLFLPPGPGRLLAS